jgi:peroxiredoxin
MNMKKYLFQMSALVLTVIVLSSATYTSNNDGYAIGDKASDFTLKGTDDKMYSLSDYKNVNGYIVVFTCNHCPYSVLYEDRLIELADQAKEMGFAMVAVNPNDPAMQPEDSFENMKIRAKEKAFNFPYLLDEGQKVYPKYGATRTPHVFIMDKNMIVQYIGAVDDNSKDASEVKEKYMYNAMKAIKKGKTPDPATTKAIGCTIKTKKGKA